MLVGREGRSNWPELEQEDNLSPDISEERKGSLLFFNSKCVVETGATTFKQEIWISRGGLRNVSGANISGSWV